MHHRRTAWSRLIGVPLTLALLGAMAPGRTSLAGEGAESPPLSTEEAQRRAALLHETVGAMLEVVHHRYYREDEGLPIPARAFQAVFRTLADREQVELRWLAVDAEAMNVDHQPRDDFEREAARTLAAGARHFEQTTDGVHRRAAPIRLGAECLKCHLPNRTSTRDRTAALVITQRVAP